MSLLKEVLYVIVHSTMYNVYCTHYIMDIARVQCTHCIIHIAGAHCIHFRVIQLLLLFDAHFQVNLFFVTLVTSSIKHTF